jgi:hydroxyacylglutathione hydrolase
MKILTLTLGPVQTNTYIVADPETKEAIVIDPSWDGANIAKTAEEQGWQIKEIWLTHAHFDHIGGIADLVKALPETPPIYLHNDDYDLWKMDGGGARFGINIDPGPEPESLEHGQILKVGKFSFEARHTPGHRPGHSVFYCAEASTLFSGDLLFYRSVGRTDLPGGDWATLEESIREQVYVLPDETQVYSGHGDATTVGDEKRKNHFVQG